MTMPPPALRRREVLQRIGAVGVGAVVTACGGSGSGGAAASTATRTVTASATAVAATRTPTATVAPSDTSAPSPTPSASPMPTVTAEQINCILSPQQTLGPYFVDVGLARRDIREDRDGVLLNLALRVVDADGCTPIGDAVVNIWHADASGAYSGFAGQPGGIDTAGETFLRGFQITDADGLVRFVTIYPGWYPGRTVHIHVRIHLDATTVLITQLYFPEQVTDTVHAQAPYASHGQRDSTNATDSIFDADVLLDLAADGEAYAASLVLGAAL